MAITIEFIKHSIVLRRIEWTAPQAHSIRIAWQNFRYVRCWAPIQAGIYRSVDFFPEYLCISLLLSVCREGRHSDGMNEWREREKKIFLLNFVRIYIMSKSTLFPTKRKKYMKIKRIFLFVGCGLWSSLTHTPSQSMSNECICFCCVPAVLIRCTIYFFVVALTLITARHRESKESVTERRRKKNGCQCYGMCVSNCEFIYCCLLFKHRCSAYEQICR